MTEGVAYIFERDVVGFIGVTPSMLSV